GDHLVGMFAPRLRRAALRQLREKGVEVRLGAAVDRVEGGQLVLKDGTSIDTATIMWAAGVRAGDLAQTVSAPHVGQGRVSVSPTLQLTAHPEVLVIGDMAGAEQNGNPLPMVAPVAQQAGRYAATSIGRLIAGEPLTPFRYRDRGVMATIGRRAAVAQVGPFRFSGLLAWLAWLGLHIVTLIGFRNRLLVLINWAYDYYFFDRAVRLILHSAARAEPATSFPPAKTPPHGSNEPGT
ncbi:MAG: NAD(P)/FAD-dependent oxidoreductase, partial [Dehalococcoidia bacterium]